MTKQTRIHEPREASRKSSIDQPASGASKSDIAAATSGVATISWPTAVKPKAKQKKQLMSLRVDVDLLTWFKEKGPGYQTRMNAVLRAFAENAQINNQEE